MSVEPRNTRNTQKISLFMEKLLDGVEVAWKPLGEIVSPKRGRRLVKSQLEEVGSYAVYQNCMTPLGYSQGVGRHPRI